MNHAENLEEIACLLASYAVRFGSEDQMQADIQAALAYTDHYVEREKILPTGRIDFYLPDWKLGIECKVQGGRMDIVRQLLRYASDEAIDALLLVSSKSNHDPRRALLLDVPLRFLWVAEGQL